MQKEIAFCCLILISFLCHQVATTTQIEIHANNNKNNNNNIPDIRLTPSPTECVKCKAFFTSVIKALGANATAADLQAAMISECDKTTQPGSEEQRACLEFADFVVHELPQVERTFEYYEPVGLCSIVGVCVVHCCSGSAVGTPQQITLAPTGNPSEMAVTWISSYAGATKKPAPAVRFWLTSQGSANPTLLAASNHTYTRGGWQGQINSAVLTGLTPGRVSYSYQVGDATLGLWSATASFRSWLAPGMAGSYAMVADIGIENSAGTVQGLSALAANHSIDFLGAYGDLSYADAYQAIWDEQGRRLQPITQQVPYLVTPGNHEIPWEFVALRNRFTMPSPGWRDGSAKYYSVNWGLAHLVFLDSELEEDLPHFGPAQLSWLQQDLAQANQNRTQFPWIIVGFHRPLYCSHGDPNSDENCFTFALYMRSQIEDILYQNKVDLVLYGHVHSYERTWPTYRNQPVQFNYTSPTAPTYILNGAAGNPEGNTDSFNPMPPPNNWAAAHTGQFGYGVITIPDASTLVWEFYTSPATGPIALFDSIKITK